MTSASARARVLLIALISSACQSKSKAPPPVSSRPTASASASVVAAPRAPKDQPLSGERVQIPGGATFIGSVPGDAGRVPELEPRRQSIELGPFQIDRLPYPNDPAQPPKTNVTREEALRLCAERGARLCTELEWERACKGPGSDDYSTGARYEPSCADELLRCASGFDALGLGTALYEWTSSEIGTESSRKGLLRGAPKRADGTAHRCAARTPTELTAHNADIGFRCCAGAPNAAIVPTAQLDVTFKKTRISADELAKLLAQSPETASLAKNLTFFKDPDSAETVISRGPGDRKGFTFGTAPLLWNPVAGAELLLVSARSGENTSFVVAFHVLGEGKYRLASSFILKNEPGPVAFAYDNGLRPRLHFSSCWGCPGETGKILFRKPERAVILQP